MKLRILATLGPASLRGDVLGALEGRIDGFVIDLAGSAPDEVGDIVDLVRRHARSVPVCLRTTAAALRPPISRGPTPELVGSGGEGLAALQVGLRRGVRRVALSSPPDAASVARLRALLPDEAWVLSVIDSPSAWRHRLEIMDASDAVALERSHLVAVTPSEYFPYRQKAFLRYAQRSGRPAFVTNGSHQPLVGARKATVAQCGDIVHSLMDGACGFLLTVDTATGSDPVGSVDGLLRSVRAFEHRTVADPGHPPAPGFEFAPLVA